MKFIFIFSTCITLLLLLLFKKRERERREGFKWKGFCFVVPFLPLWSVFIIFFWCESEDWREDKTMLALLQNCSMPLARAVRSPPRTHVRPCFTAVAYASISSRANSQSQVLLGLSEKELQQLALDLNQVNLSSFPIQLHQNII